MAKNYSFRVRMNLSVRVPDKMEEKEAKKKIEKLVSEVLARQYDEDDVDDEDEEDGEDTEMFQINEVIPGTFRAKPLGIVRTQAEISYWLLNNPGYTTANTVKGVKFSPFKSTKSYEAPTLIEAVSAYLEDNPSESTQVSKAEEDRDDDEIVDLRRKIRKRNQNLKGAKGRKRPLDDDDY